MHSFSESKSEAGEQIDAAWEKVVEHTPEPGPLQAARWPLWRSMLDGDSPVATNFENFMRLLRLVFAQPSESPDVPLQAVFVHVPFGTSSHERNLYPVVDELIERNIPVVLLLGPLPSRQWRRFEERIPVLTIQDLYGSVASIRRLRAALDAPYETFRMWHQLRERSQQLGDAVIDSLEWWLVFHWRYRVVRTAVTQLVDNASPGFILTSYDQSLLGYELARQARSINIPTGNLQHGSFGPEKWPFFSDEMYVWGESFRRQMIEFGAPSSRLLPLGMPAADSRFERDQQMRHSDRNSDASETFRAVMISNTHGIVRERAMFESFREFFPRLVEQTPNVSWVVKLHPHEDRSFYDTFETDIQNQLRFIPPEVSLDKVVSESDVALGLNTTGTLDALMLHRPTLVLSPHPRVEKLVWWPEHGGGRRVHTVEEAAATLRRLRDESGFRRSMLERQERFLEDAFTNRGTAAEAIADRITSRRNADRAPDASQTSQIMVTSVSS